MIISIVYILGRGDMVEQIFKDIVTAGDYPYKFISEANESLESAKDLLPEYLGNDEYFIEITVYKRKRN